MFSDLTADKMTTERENPPAEYEFVPRLARRAVYVQYHLADKVTDTASHSLRRLSRAAGHGA